MSRPASVPVPPMPRFCAWIKEQGRTQAEQASTIGVGRRTLQTWTDGSMWPSVQALRKWPDGLRKLADDLEEIRLV